MKVVGLEEFVPESWSQPDFDKKLVEDTKDEMGWFGISFTIWVTLREIWHPRLGERRDSGSGLAVTFLGTAGQSYTKRLWRDRRKTKPFCTVLNGAVRL